MARMKQELNRRQFLASITTLVATGLTFGWEGARARAQAALAGYQTKLRKALIIKQPTEAELKRLNDAGFDGVEGGVIPVAEAEKCRAAAEKAGMKIHSVLRGWAEFNSPDSSRVESTLAVTEDAIRCAHAFGADNILLVPCRLKGPAMPKPREFEIEFDEKTGHVTKVVRGDNAPYAEYIRAHNLATDTSRPAVKRLIPLAEKLGVTIALENVWNNLWVKPALFKSFVASFGSPWVKAYFDIGNHVKYAPPEEWILTLGSLIARCHVKDFRLNDDPGGDGKFVDIRDGSVNWPAVRGALEKIGYSGWMTIEGGKCSVEEHSRRLDLIIAGK